MLTGALLPHPSGVVEPRCRGSAVESEIVNIARRCSKTGCRAPAVATLTFAYADRAVVLGPLATYAEPHTYDLCSDHTVRLTAPRGWEVVRLIDDLPLPSDPGSAGDDLFDLASALQEVSPAPAQPATVASAAGVSGVLQGELGRRGHLRVVRGAATD